MCFVSNSQNLKTKWINNYLPEQQGLKKLFLLRPFCEEEWNAYETAKASIIIVRCKTIYNNWKSNFHTQQKLWHFVDYTVPTRKNPCKMFSIWQCVSLHMIFSMSFHGLWRNSRTTQARSLPSPKRKMKKCEKFGIYDK